MSLEELTAQAKKAYETKQFDLAVELFGEACGTYAAEHEGQEDPDLLFQYGTALFQLARTTTSLLNTENVDNVNKPMPAGVDGGNISLAPLEELEVVPEGEKTSAELAKEEQEAEAAARAAENAAEGAAEQDEEDADAEGAAPEAAAEEEEVDDFTAAWQMMDLCRVLYSRELDIAKDKSKIEHKLCKVYETLGEISIEDDNYEQAAIDFQSALELKQKLYNPDDQVLSEAHYMLALSLELKSDSIDDKKSALSNLQAAVDIAKKSGVNKQLIQDLRQKVHDLKREIDSMKSTAPTPSPSSGGIDRSAIAGMLESMGSAQDIGSLVKRKKKSDESGDNTERKKLNFGS